MKTGLVMEGGAMRGMFTCGVIDVLMENDITFDGAIGVSAGTVFGCNYKSRQPGRPIRYNKAYCRNWRYASFRSLLLTGNLFGVQFCYDEIPNRLDPFDEETYEANPMEFYVTCTDLESGKAVYHFCPTGKGEDLLWMQASASMPLVSRPVTIKDRKYLDGGIGDSIPLRFFESIGYDRNVVILTQPADYVKGPNSFIPLAKILLRHYPDFIKAMEDRHIRYNETTTYVKAEEAAGRTFVICPPCSLNIGSTTKDPEELERVYQIGRKTAEMKLKELKRYISGTDLSNE